MARRFDIIGTLVVLAILAGAAWVFARNIFADPSTSDPSVVAAGDATTDDADEVPIAKGPVVARDVAIAPTGLAIPVDGIDPHQLVDTYTQSRGGGSRVHNAIDIMAPAGKTVIAAAPGTVEKIFFSQGGGGNTIYVRSDDGLWSYYYAHLDAYAPNLKEGQKVARGTPLGTVGVSGNANPAGPHLHFAINRMRAEDRWYQGVPINPYPLLAGNKSPR